MVTGGTDGIGKFTAEQLAKLGSTVGALTGPSWLQISSRGWFSSQALCHQSLSVSCHAFVHVSP